MQQPHFCDPGRATIEQRTGLSDPGRETIEQRRGLSDIRGQDDLRFDIESENYDPKMEFSRKVKEYCMNDSRPTTGAEDAHIHLLRDINDSYDGQIDASSSLDGYYHVPIDDADLNLRNGDQVISRFIARWRVKHDDGLPDPWSLSEEAWKFDHQKYGKGYKGKHKEPQSSGRNTPRSFTNHGLSDPAQGLSPRQMIVTVPKLWAWRETSEWQRKSWYNF